MSENNRQLKYVLYKYKQNQSCLILNARHIRYSDFYVSIFNTVVGTIVQRYSELALLCRVSSSITANRRNTEPGRVCNIIFCSIF